MVRCICEICVCGKHQCEHNKHRVPFAKDKDECNKLSEHKDRYRYLCYQPPELPIKPTAGADWTGNEPPVKVSTTKRDYVAFPIQRRTLRKQKAYKEPEGKIASCTTYKHDFKPKKGAMRSTFKGAACTKDGTMPGTLPGKIEGETTYGISYPEKHASRREQVKAKECTLTILGQPFLGDTITKLCYQPPPYCKREKMQPREGEGVLKPGGDFIGNTTHKTDFTPKYQDPAKPIKTVSKWKLYTGEFEGITTHAHDFRCPSLSAKPELIVPKGSLMKFEGPFDGVSHYKRDYPAYDIVPRKLPKWHPSFRQHKKPDASMMGQTIYKTDYEPPPEELLVFKPKPIKNNITIPSGPMEKVTTSMRDYRNIDNPILAKSCKPDIQYIKPEGKFADCTTTKCDYTLKSGDRAKPEITKQADNLGLESGPMEDITTTMRDFQWMCLDCPAKYIKLYGKDALPQYRFEKREGGHDYFKKLKKPKK